MFNQNTHINKHRSDNAGELGEMVNIGIQSKRTCQDEQAILADRYLATDDTRRVESATRYDAGLANRSGRPNMQPQILLNRYMEPLLRGERKSCRQLVTEALEAGAPPRAIIQNLIWPAMETVNKLYRDDRINAASEHMATRINRLVADQVHAHLEQAASNGRRALIVCANDEPEELEAQMCADLFEADGWEVFFVGGGVPDDEILSLVGELRPTIMVLVGAKPSDAPKARTLVTMLREVDSNPTMNVMVTGGVFNRAEGMWQEVQADLFAPNAAEALAIANTAKPRTPTTTSPDAPKKRRRRRRAPLLEPVTARV